MSLARMTIHRALSELKTYDDRLERLMQSDFVQSNKKSNERIQGKTIEEVRNGIKGSYDSYRAMSENQKRIKAAVVQSNAGTKVTIGGVEYAVAEAIERKAKLANDEMFIKTLKTQFAYHNNKVENENGRLPEKLEQYLQAVLGGKDKRTAEEIASYTKTFEERNTYELIDPRDIAGQIKELEEQVAQFRNEVDYVLSESNATTFIEIDFAD